MPRAGTARKIIIADTEEELMALTAEAETGQSPSPGPRPAPDDPVPAPANVPDEDDPELDDPEDGEANEDDDPGTVEEDPEGDDDPLDPHPKDALQAHNDLRRQLYGEQRTPKPRQGLIGEIIEKPTQGYEARITIVEAWQYPGNLQNAPDWVDRNWVGYGDYDTIRMIEPGPCLRVPNATGEVTLCRIGDYMAQQEVRLDDRNSDLRIEVWAKEHFHKLFIPTSSPKAR